MIHLWEWLSQKILKISRNPVQPRPHLVLRISLAANVRNLTITEIIEIQMWGISQLKPQIHVGLSLKSWIDCDLSYLFWLIIYFLFISMMNIWRSMNIPYFRYSMVIVIEKWWSRTAIISQVWTILWKLGVLYDSELWGRNIQKYPAW